MEIVIALIVINVVVFITPFIIPFSGRYPDSFSNFLSLGWKSNIDITNGDYYRFLTSTFLHGDIFHLLFNMWSLWNIGPLITQIFKPGAFLLIYLVSGIAGSYCSYLFNSSPSIGASGSIFGLLGALLAYSILSGNSSLLTSILVNIIIIVLYSVFLNPRIDNFGHIGGLVAGFILGYICLIARFQIAL